MRTFSNTSPNSATTSRYSSLPLSLPSSKIADKMGAVQAFIFYFKCYSILHFAVCQLLCWPFLLYSFNRVKWCYAIKNYACLYIRPYVRLV